MIKNYLKVVLRNMLKHKFFSAVNLLGMTVGITACLLIILYIQDELSYDRFHPNADRIYQVGLHGKIGGQEIFTSNTCPPLAAALASEVPEVESSTRIDPMYGQTVVRVNDKSFIEQKLFFVDSNFFDFFGYHLLEGDSRTALKEPNTVVLSQKMARKYFDGGAAVGKLITIGNDNKTYKIAGIAEDSPANSHFRYEFLVSSHSSDDMKRMVWLNNFMFTYFTLRPKTSVEGVQAKMDALVEKYVGPEIEKFMGISIKQMKQQGGTYGYFTTPLTGIHLHSISQNDLEPGGNVVYVYSFGIIAVFILVIASINFMNMSTAKSAGRAKEVGLRKTLGSLKEQMIGQFLAESLFYSLLAMLLSLAATYFLLPGFNLLAGKELGLASLITGQFIAGIALVTVLVGLGAGSYPAFYLTSFNVVEVLKGKVRSGAKSQGVRSAMVVFQFGISIFLIIATVIVFNQLHFMQDKDLGIDKKNVLYINNMDRLGVNKRAFRNSMAQRSYVTAASFASNAFPGINNTTVFKADGTEQDHIMGLYRADYDQQSVMKFTMVSGRYFSKDFVSDSLAIILNETAASEFGWADPINQIIRFNGSGKERRYHVIGIYKDFNFESLKDHVRPLAMLFLDDSNLLTIRYQGDPKKIVSAVEALWKSYAAGEPLQYHFLDDNYDALFRAEQRLSKIIMIFSGLAIFIACMGLFALSACTAEQRTKEIGIRKAMGASVSSLAMMMSKEFIMLVIIAFGLFCLPAWWLADWWLKSFAYRVPINPMIFVLSGLAAILVAWLTVSYQALKAAGADPVKSLRYE